MSVVEKPEHAQTLGLQELVDGASGFFAGEFLIAKFPDHGTGYPQEDTLVALFKTRAQFVGYFGQEGKGCGSIADQQTPEKPAHLLADGQEVDKAIEDC